MTEYINPIEQKPYSEKDVKRVRNLLSDVTRMVKEGDKKLARNTFEQRMSNESRHAGYGKLPKPLRRLARMMFRDIVGDLPKDVNERRRRVQEQARKSMDRAAQVEETKKVREKVARIKAKVSSGTGGGNMKTPDETARGRMSLLKKKM